MNQQYYNNTINTYVYSAFPWNNWNRCLNVVVVNKNELISKSDVYYFHKFSLKSRQRPSPQSHRIRLSFPTRISRIQNQLHNELPSAAMRPLHAAACQKRAWRIFLQVTLLKKVLKTCLLKCFVNFAYPLRGFVSS